MLSFEGIEFLQWYDGRTVALPLSKESAHAYAKSDYWVYPIVPVEEINDDLKATNWSNDGMIHYEV